MNTEHEWLEPLLRKRTVECVQILMHLLRHGIAHGQVTANDIPPGLMDLIDQPNSIGGVFQVLRRFGFEFHGQTVKGVHKRQHSRWVRVWVLDDTLKARKVVSAIEGYLLACTGAVKPSHEQLALI